MAQMPFVKFLSSYLMVKKLKCQWTITYIEEELHPSVPVVLDPPLKWYDCEQVVSQDDDLDSHCGEVEDWVEHTDLSDYGDVLELFVV